jgi:uncharacterized protein (TIGR02246 family)
LPPKISQLSKEKSILRNVSLLLCLALAVLGVACSNAPAPAAAPADTRAADVQAVKDLEVAWSKDAASKDPEKWASFFAEDGSALYPGMATINGKAAIKAALTPMFADPNFAISFQSNRQMASKGGDMVYTQGTYSMTMTDAKSKKPVTDKGKFMTVYAKQADGSWKVVADTFNSDMPAM